MRTALREWVKKKGIYYQIKYSRAFRLYEKICKPSIIREEQKEVAFYRSFLDKSRLIFDIGAYDGHKTVAFLTFSDKVVCCEPDGQNLSLLRTRFRNRTDRVQIEDIALSDRAGVEKLLIHEKGSAFNTLNPKWKTLLEEDNITKWTEEISFSGETREVQTQTLDQLIVKYGLPDFIKIDVEGYENKVLAGLHTKIPCLSFECMLPDFGNELSECLSHVTRISPAAIFNVAQFERLIFPEFISQAELQRWIASTAVHHFEVVVKFT